MATIYRLPQELEEVKNQTGTTPMVRFLMRLWRSIKIVLSKSNRVSKKGELPPEINDKKIVYVEGVDPIRGKYYRTEFDSPSWMAEVFQGIIQTKLDSLRSRGLSE